LETYFLIGIFILLLPFVHYEKTLDFNAAPRLLLFGIAIVIFAVWNIIKHKAGLQFVKLLVFPVSLLYLIWSIATLMPAVNPGEGSFEIAKTILTLGLLVYAVQIIISKKKTVLILLQSVIISALIATIVGLYQYFTKVLGSNPSDMFITLYAVKGMMAHKNQFAISLLLMLPFIIYGV